MFYEVIPGKLFSKHAGFLTYASDAELLPGQIVSIPLGKSEVPGIIYKKVIQPDFPTKKILKILYSKPLPSHIVKTIVWLSQYYLIPLPQALNLFLPIGITKNRRKTIAKTEQTPKLPLIELNTAQKNALLGLQKAPGATKVLFGVTGSGKTNVYLKLAQNALEAQKSTILLVPEIALTGQLVRVFREIFGDRVLVIHSQQTEAERHLIFERILLSDEPTIVIGPRSALFAPLSNLGLIIIDEEHETTYFQENPPRYSAIRVASFMAKTAKCPLVLGSATPSIEDYYFASRQGAKVELLEKAKATATKPNVRIIDFKNRDEFSKNRYYSNALLTAIKNNLAKGQQTLIFHNRRGSSPLTICENCGELIGKERLHALPFARTCIECQTLFERNKPKRSSTNWSEI